MIRLPPRATRTVTLLPFTTLFLSRVRSRLFRWLVRLAGVAHPAGGTPADMRLTFWPRRRAVRAAMTEILAWACERVVMPHGLPYERDGAAEIRRALRWAVYWPAVLGTRRGSKGGFDRNQPSAPPKDGVPLG